MNISKESRAFKYSMMLWIKKSPHKTGCSFFLGCLLSTIGIPAIGAYLTAGIIMVIYIFAYITYGALFLLKMPLFDINDSWQSMIAGTCFLLAAGVIFLISTLICKKIQITD